MQLHLSILPTAFVIQSQMVLEIADCIPMVLVTANQNTERFLVLDKLPRIFCSNFLSISERVCIAVAGLLACSVVLHVGRKHDFPARGHGIKPPKQPQSLTFIV